MRRARPTDTPAAGTADPAADAPRPVRRVRRAPSWAIQDTGAEEAFAAAAARFVGSPRTGPQAVPNTGSNIGPPAVPTAVPAAVPNAEPAPVPAAGQPAGPSLGRKVRSAARWSLINTVVMRLGNFVTGILLARFALGPAAWGVYGI